MVEDILAEDLTGAAAPKEQVKRKKDRGTEDSDGFGEESKSSQGEKRLTKAISQGAIPKMKLENKGSIQMSSDPESSTSCKKKRVNKAQRKVEEEGDDPPSQTSSMKDYEEKRDLIAPSLVQNKGGSAKKSARQT